MVVHRGKVKVLHDVFKYPIMWENAEKVWECPEGGYSVVKCNTQWDYATEGFLLAHCLGTKDYEYFGYNHRVYSLRDSFGIPHATILCVLEGEFSPYGICWDLGTRYIFEPEPREYCRVLQVRGRTDNVAMLPYHRLVREWYLNFGGTIDVDIPKLDEVIRKFEDSDYDYHFRYLLDESVNKFTWAHHNVEQRRAAILDGTSL